MAMINVTCPSCGLLQEVDEEKGFGFCTECGTKIEIQGAETLQSTEEKPATETENEDIVPIYSSGDDAILASLSEALKSEGNFVTNLSGVDECNSQFDRWLALIGKYKEVIPTLGSDINKETAINDALAFCDRIGKTKISYMTGEVGKDGKNLIKIFTPDKSRTSAVKDARTFFTSMFNNLPTRLELSRQLTEGLDSANERVNKLKASVRETREKFKASEKEFWSENPDVANRKRDVKLSSLRIILVGAILAIIAVVYACIKKQYLFIGAAVILLLLALLLSRKHAEKGIRQVKLEFFPESLKQLQGLLESYEKEYEQAEIDQKNAQEKMAAFDASRK